MGGLGDGNRMVRGFTLQANVLDHEIMKKR